jgi:tRNA threonylcarbamoyladenosine biosynthesis protein TsaB
MNLLAFDTSTETMSVAVQRSDEGVAGAGPAAQRWLHSGPGGALTSSLLIPTIQNLMAQAGLQFSQLSAIVFGCGPGSFTGLRTACAVAQGLAFGAGIKVLPVDTLLAVAEEARWQQAHALPRFNALVLLDARMDEMYAGYYLFDSGRWTQINGHSLIRPENLPKLPDCALAGNVFTVYGARLNPALGQRIDALPTASALLRLAPSLLATGCAVAPDQALPLYIRDKVAKTTLERAAEKAAT